jgi:2-phospho-L-lactate/phosphoenolpyruvate guanylyltransferase
VPEVDLLVPVKSLSHAKTRLRGAADNGRVDLVAHARLAVALIRDTVAAARAAAGVRQVLTVTSDPEVTAMLTADGLPVLADRPEGGLNAALAYGAEVLRARRPARPIGALQADLPALRAEELADALASATLAFQTEVARRAFVSDANGDGTTLLICAPHTALDPRFGPGSARAHEASGALRLAGDWPGLRRDVDTPEDLRRAAEIGLGPATLAALRITKERSSSPTGD